MSSESDLSAEDMQGWYPILADLNSLPRQANGGLFFPSLDFSTLRSTFHSPFSVSFPIAGTFPVLADLDRFKPSLAAMRIERNTGLRGTRLLRILHQIPSARRVEIASALSEQLIAASLSSTSSAREAATHLQQLVDADRQMVIVNAISDGPFALDIADELVEIQSSAEKHHSTPYVIPVPTTSAIPPPLQQSSGFGQPATPAPAPPNTLKGPSADQTFRIPKKSSTIPPNSPDDPSGDSAFNPGLDSKAKPKPPPAEMPKPSTAISSTTFMPTTFGSLILVVDAISPKAAGTGNVFVTLTRPMPALRIPSTRTPLSTWTPPPQVGLPQLRPSSTALNNAFRPQVSPSAAVPSDNNSPSATTGPQPQPFLRVVSDRSHNQPRAQLSSTLNHKTVQPRFSGQNTESRPDQPVSPRSIPTSPVRPPGAQHHQLNGSSHSSSTRNTHAREVEAGIEFKATSEETKGQRRSTTPPNALELDLGGDQPASDGDNIQETPHGVVKPQGVAVDEGLPVSGADPEEFDDDIDNGDPDLMGYGRWDWKTNEAKMKEWGLEQEIKKLADPLYTAPALTRWIFRLRSDVAGIEAYQKYRQEEFDDFVKIPKDERRHAGAIWHQHARFDWHLRVWMAVWAHTYSNADESAKKSVITQMWDELIKRFPDADPHHIVRDVGTSGGRELITKYRRRFNSWIHTVARNMRITRTARKNGGAGLFLAPRRMPGLWKVLQGKQRATTGFVAWGNNKKVKVTVDRAVNKVLDNLGLAEGSQARNRKALGVRRKILSEKFKSLPKAEKAAWKEKAKTGGKPRNETEEQIVVDNTIEMAVDIFNRVMEETGMRIVLLAAGRGEHGVPIVVREFSRSFKEGHFLATSLGQRIKHHWIDFATEIFSADPSELIEIEAQATEAINAEEFEEDGMDAQPGSSSSRDTEVRTIFQVSPFLLPADCDTRAKRDQFLGKWAIQLIGHLSAARVSWKQVCQNPDKFVDPKRMPVDPDDPRKERRFKFEEPSRMTNPASKAFWKHVVDSASGSLLEAEAFTVKAFEAHRLIPKVVVPKTAVHHAAANALKTKPVKKKGKVPIAGSKTKEKLKAGKKQGRGTEDEEEEDFADILEGLDDVEEWSDELESDGGVDESVAMRSRSKNRKSAGNQPIAQQEEDFELGDDLAGYEYKSDDSFEDPNWQPSPKSDARLSKFPKKPPIISSPALSASSQHPPPADDAPPLDHDISKKRNTIIPAQTDKPEIDDPAYIKWGIDQLFHPDILTVTPEQSAGFDLHWNSFKKYGAYAFFVGEQQRSLPLSANASGQVTFPFPPGVDSAMCLSHIWHIFQAPDIAKIRGAASLSDSGPLSSIDPEHHVRLVMADVLNVDCALPSVKFIESTLAAPPGAFNALLLHFENLLIEHNDHIISSPDLIQHGDLSLLQSLRLATIVHSSGFIRDKGRFGHHCARVQGISDRFVQTLGAISLVRYFQEVLGRSIVFWCQQSKSDAELRNLWLRNEAFWEKGIKSLVGAMVAGRIDLFDLTIFYESASAGFQKSIEMITSQMAWWTPKNGTVPAIQTLKGKLSIPNSEAHYLLQSMNWQTATFMDRALAMLLVFAGGVQLSMGRIPPGDNPRVSQLTSWVKLICKMTISISDHDAEVGALGPTSIDRSSEVAEVRDWIAIWEQEAPGGPGTRLSDEIDDAKAEKLLEATSLPSPSPRAYRDASGTLIISMLHSTDQDAVPGSSPGAAIQTPSRSHDQPPPPPGTLEVEPKRSPPISLPSGTAPGDGQGPGEMPPPAPKRRRGNQGTHQLEVKEVSRKTRKAHVQHQLVDVSQSRVMEAQTDQTGAALDDSTVKAGGLALPQPRKTRQKLLPQAHSSTPGGQQTKKAAASKVPAKRKAMEAAEESAPQGRPGRPKKIKVAGEAVDARSEENRNMEGTEKDRAKVKTTGKGGGGGKPKGQAKPAAAANPAVRRSERIGHGKQ